MIGKTLAHYEITALLGKGGMGEVYRARDKKLKRDVALKVLPAGTANDPERIARFEREAHSLATLQHPNVASIYGYEEADGVRFLTMELAEGQDLAARLSRGRIPVDEIIHIAAQILSGLETAHDRGIIHRDLKPANIKLSSDGVVKILDFGLARAYGDDVANKHAPEISRTTPVEMTEAGMILGTPAYMSPEQARGKPVDTRTDIWAFGCVLYEMLTGDRAFTGSDVTETLAAVLRSEPDWNRLPTDTPENVERLLRRCLAKDPRSRLHHISDARLELEESGLSTVPKQENTRTFGMAFGGSLFALAAALSFVLFLLFGPDAVPVRVENPLAGARFTRVTDFPGSEYDATISRDGRFVAFVSDHEGVFQVYVTQVGTNIFRRLTDYDSQVNYVREVGRSGFNADGTEIWIGGGMARRMRSAPLLGGPARNFMHEDAVNVDWSPDGQRMVYHDRTPGDPLFVADGDATNPREILRPAAGTHQHFPRWSIDGEWIFLVRGRPATGEMDLWRVRPNGGDLERLTQRKLFVGYPTPIDESTTLYVAREMDGAGPWLWAVNVDTGVSRRVSIGLERYNSIATNADHSRLVATIEDPRAELWSVPILERIATHDDAVPFEGTAGLRALAPRFGGSSLYFLSSLGSGDGLYRFREGEISEIWRGAESALMEPPAISPDGAWLTVLLRREEGWHLYLLSSDGSQRRRLSDRVDARGAATWSPDGRWVVTGGVVDGSPGLFKISVTTGEVRRLVEGEAINPVWSPDGMLIVYAGNQVSAVSPLQAVNPEGNPVDLPEIQLWRGGERCRFTPDGSALIVMQGLQPAQDFVRLDLVTMELRALTRFDQTATMRTFDITPDGTRIVFDRLHEDSDIVLIDLERSATVR